MSGLGVTSTKFRTFPATLVEANFYESKFLYSNIWQTDFCPPYLICVDPITKGTNICFQDDGSPLYTSSCDTKHGDCLLGVASFFSRNYFDPPYLKCTEGSFFANVPHSYDWIMKTMREN
ncbi:uncharacterized protein LOC134845981 [Symsagittifera roscoffensis]|uniref:uncharacterized protein LOC134845981 n=1 Tax=Symsagittifera roscoffensis TaxID=84072 RepID=UPI00307BA5C1